MFPLDDDAVAAAIAKIEDMAAIWGEGLKALTPKQRMRALKVPNGAHALMPLLAAVAKRHAWSVRGVDMMLPRTRNADILKRAGKRLELAGLYLQDCARQLDGEAWKTATVMYSGMSRIAPYDGNLYAALAPARKFFKKQGRKRASAGGPGKSKKTKRGG